MSVRILIGDVRDRLAELPGESVDCVVTSPPYFGLRDYGVDGQIGLEATPFEHVDLIADVFDGVRRVLKPQGTLWLNYGDSYATDPKGPGGVETSNLAGGGEYQHLKTKPGFNKWDYRGAGLKRKDLCGIPWRVAFALQERGWWLRQDIIWSKPNPMPESIRDRCTKAHEYLFLLAKSERYYFDQTGIAEPATRADQAAFVDNPAKDKQRGHGRRHEGFNGQYADRIRAEGAPTTRNKRSVWEVPTQPFSEAHFATFPPALIEPCILAGCPEGGTVLDPFFGAGTTGLVADRLGRSCIGIELNPEYAELAMRRCRELGFDAIKHDAAEACGLLDYQLSVNGIIPPWRADNILEREFMPHSDGARAAV